METLQKHEPEIVSNLVIHGDLGKLDPKQKVEYYKLFCERLGLDPLTQPFKILNLNGKEVLYCDRSGAAQLNKKHGVSHEIKSRDTQNELYIVTCRASMRDRFTESIGAVSVKGLSGDNLANAMMKSETKAKRRATLDLLGLGILDETETETIQGAQTIDIPYTCDELKDNYLKLLQDYGELVGMDGIKKLYPDNWTKEQNTESFMKAIDFVKGKIADEKAVRDSVKEPHGVKGIGDAARHAADKDDFYERNR